MAEYRTLITDLKDGEWAEMTSNNNGVVRAQSKLIIDNVENWPLQYASRILGWYCSEDAPVGSIASLPDRRIGAAPATQASAPNQPVGESPTMSHLKRIKFVGASGQYLALNAAVYNALAGATNFASHTVITRCRPSTWSDRNVFGVQTGTGFHQYYCTNNPAFRYVGARGALLSDVTDRSDTTRYVAFVYDATSVSKTISIIERGSRVSAAVTNAAETPVAASMGSAGSGPNPFDGWIDELIIFSGTMSDAEITASLPYLFRERRSSLMCVGNSFGAGYAGATPYLSQLEDLLPLELGVFAAYCRGAAETPALVSAMTIKLPGQVIPGRSALFFWEATNSIALSNATLAQLKDYHALARNVANNLNIPIYGATCLPRSSFTPTNESVRVAWNNELITNPTPYVTDARHIVRLDLVPELQNPANLTYYLDGTHPTTAGCALIAQKCAETFVPTL